LTAVASNRFNPSIGEVRARGSRVSLKAWRPMLDRPRVPAPRPPPPPRAEVVAVHQDSHGGKKWSRQISRHPPGVGFSSVYPSSTATRAKPCGSKMFLATPDPFSPDLVGPPEESASKPVRVAGDEQRGLSRSSVGPTQEHRASESESEGVVTRHRRGQHVRPCPHSVCWPWPLLAFGLCSCKKLFLPCLHPFPFFRSCGHPV
jgi:hypothetical protein